MDVGNNAHQVSVSKPWLHIRITWRDVCLFVCFNTKSQAYLQKFAFNYSKVGLRRQYFFKSSPDDFKV